MRIEGQDLGHAAGVKGKIQPGAGADLQHPSFSQRDRPLPVGFVPRVAHRQINQARQYPILVKSHNLS